MTTETAVETTGLSRAAPTPRPRAANPRRKKGEGGAGMEPLTQRAVQEGRPSNVRARIENVYASIPVDRFAGTGYIPSVGPGSTAARPRHSSRGSSMTSTSCSASASMAVR